MSVKWWRWKKTQLIFYFWDKNKNIKTYFNNTLKLEEKRINQYLEVGCQADDGQMAEFISLCGGQLWKRGCSLWKSRENGNKKRKREIHSRAVCECHFAGGVKQSYIIEALLITLKCKVTPRHTDERGDVLTVRGQSRRRPVPCCHAPLVTGLASSPRDGSSDSSSKGSSTQLYETKCALLAWLGKEGKNKVGYILFSGDWLIFSIKLDIINIALLAGAFQHITQTPNLDLKTIVYC